ncbi:MAG: hypothetical protein DRN29_05425 [Thermoplasmata archaeon]|nr:MAG: hypothetical protein DRN29_05425 [Thermoplasmata archaeon]
MLGTRKNKLIAIVAIVILLSMILWYLSTPAKEKKEEKVFDDRISPMENQALFVEILRIRNRGLMDKMLSYSLDWRNPPSFYYIIKVDGKEGSSKGNVGETGVYTTWDTIGYESSMVFDVDEEKEYSDVTISIIELVPTGLFGRNVKEVEKERISLRYDYRTGRWTGDDYFMDKDGMGHYLGKNYEIWFNLYQADYDHDGIPYWVEVNVLGTDPAVDDSKLDPDNDGIPTSWEWKYGYDPFTYNEHSKLDPDIDGIENIEEYKMRKYFANPFQPDIYIETDGMEKKGFFDLPHIFYKESQQMIIERFARHGINVYIDDGWNALPNGGGELLPYQANLDDILGKQLLAFYEHNFPDERKGIFRYVVVGVRKDGGGFITPVKYNRFDAIYVSNDFNSMMTRIAFTPREIRVMLAKAILHELGHSLGLMPGIFPGIDLVSRRVYDRYPNMPDDEYNAYLEKYYSVMNYQYIYNKPWFYSENRSYLFDYSDGSNGLPYDWNDWEHIYLPTFQTDVPAYEDPSIETFEDFKPVKDYPELVAKGWKYDENLTEKYGKELEKLVLVKNTDAEIKILIKEDAEENEYNLRIYAKPNVDPVFAVYSLVAEGKLVGSKIEFYSQQALIDYAREKIKESG